MRLFLLKLFKTGVEILIYKKYLLNSNSWWIIPKSGFYRNLAGLSFCTVGKLLSQLIINKSFVISSFEIAKCVKTVVSRGQRSFRINHIFVNIILKHNLTKVSSHNPTQQRIIYYQRQLLYSLLTMKWKYV